MKNDSNKHKNTRIVYKNWRGEVAVRRIQPIELWFGRTQYHPEEQWMLRAHDLDKKAVRDFAVKDIQKWQP